MTDDDASDVILITNVEVREGSFPKLRRNPHTITSLKSNYFDRCFTVNGLGCVQKLRIHWSEECGGDERHKLMFIEKYYWRRESID